VVGGHVHLALRTPHVDLVHDGAVPAYTEAWTVLWCEAQVQVRATVKESTSQTRL
jgi:hypothetical protein